MSASFCVWVRVTHSSSSSEIVALNCQSMQSSGHISAQWDLLLWLRSLCLLCMQQHADVPFEACNALQAITSSYCYKKCQMAVA